MPYSNVLIITYLFPPSGGIGPPRYVAYTRYLPQHGCQVSVLTARRPATPLYDPDLAAKVPPSTQVYRAFNPEVSYEFRDRIWKWMARGKVDGVPEPQTTSQKSLLAPARGFARRAIQSLFAPDVQKFWIPFAMRLARRIIRQNNIDTVILNTPPFSLFGIIAPLKREFPHLKWITEIRDDWVGYYLENFDSAIDDRKRRLAIRMEAEGIRASDFVVPVTPAQTSAVRARYPDQPESKFLCVPNGYDAELFENFQARPKNQGRMVVTYFGSLYASPPYSPVGYLEALDSLPEQVRSRIETRFIGRVVREAAPLLEGRRAAIRQLGFFPRAEGIRLLEETDYLLLIVNDPTAHAGKLFDYLASGAPILALTPPSGEIAGLMRETRAGKIVDGRDVEGIRAALLAMWEEYQEREGHWPDPNWPAIRAYERRNLVARLVEKTGIGKPA